MRMLWCSILSAVLLVSLAQANPLSKPPAAEDSSVQSRSEAANSLDSTENENTIPENVHPSDYTIKLEPHLVDNDFTFSGESKIDVNIGTATSTIVLHAAGLKIEESFTSLVDVEESIPSNAIKHSLDPVKELLVIEFAKPIKPGTHTLNLKYTGTLETEPKGFYRSMRKIDQQNVWEAFTQFKPSNARRAFPCFDETSMKARFTISIKQPENYAVMSTALAVSGTESDNSWTQLKTTDLVSTDDIEFKVVYVPPPNTTPIANTDGSSGSRTTDALSENSTTDKSSENSTTDKSSENSTTDKSSENSTTDKSSENSTTDKSSENSTTDKSSENSTTDKSSENSTTDKSSENSTTDKSSENSTTDKSSGSSTPDESSGSSTTDESSGSSTTDESSGSSTTDESSGSSTTDESSGTSTTDESSGSSTTETNGATAAPSTTGAANIALPTLPLTILIGLLARLVVAQAL